ncbi:MAG: hypothetical protein CFH40_01242 [Alphaproteobacteria bacterium MarineAlpha10_Bin3]|jgi:hypothetical protein|nr:MAG: hypothetical protein CFH40_01242 [Alphaproteobacteria bacterium MarineAlpha10_Bin3]PPR71232.1 MAG: hypothetical protein CFH09_01242 [Alphaproteobacteria bacterium MarineAlpha4_Bin1]
MSDPLLYQIRINLDDALAQTARRDHSDPALKPLLEILGRHNAVLKCQFDAFAGYVADAEKHGLDGYPLYAWTKATIEDPLKEAKYIKAFTLYVDGDEVYAKQKADALEAALQPLVDSKLVATMTKHDTNPANSPQMPERYRM